MEFRQDLIPLAKLGLPGSLLFLQLAEAVLTDFGQADPVQSVPAHLKRILTLVRGNESSLAFAKQLDEDLSLLGAEFQCPAELLRGVPRMLSRDDCDPLGWQEERVLRNNWVVGSTMSMPRGSQGGH